MTSEARFVVNVIALTLTYGGAFAVCAFTWLKGRSAERYGSSVLASSSLIIVGFQLATRQSVPIVPEVLVDTAVAVTFLVLAIRYNNLWLGAAMIIKGVQLAINGAHLTEWDDAKIAGFQLYPAILNLITLLTLLIFVAATIASIRDRHRLRKQAKSKGASAASTPMVRTAEKSIQVRAAT